MSLSRFATSFAVCVLCVTPSVAQGSGSQGGSSAVASAATDALKALGSAAKDKLLVRDLLGAKVSGPNGSNLGTVADLVVIPGGRVIAAIISTDDKNSGRVPVPFSVAKVSHSAGKLGVALPISLSDLKGMKEVQSLAKAIPGLN